MKKGRKPKKSATNEPKDNSA